MIRLLGWLLRPFRQRGDEPSPSAEQQRVIRRGEALAAQNEEALRRLHEQRAELLRRVRAEGRVQRFLDEDRRHDGDRTNLPY